MSATNTRERQARIADVWTRNPDMIEADVLAEVDASLAVEAEAEAERAAKANEISESLDAFWSCRACRGPIAPGTRDAYCDDCRAAAFVLHGMQALEDDIGDYTRRALIEAELMARQEGA